MKKLSIICLSYNQEKYIKQTLDSFLMQKTNFDFDIIISDDASTDNTPQIIQEFADKYPEKIKAILRKQNVGAEINYIETCDKVKSQYVLYSDGDDFFIDVNKLQTQVDFLEANPDFSICFHPVRVFFEDNSQPEHKFPSPEIRFNKEVLELQHLFSHNFIQTNSCMYRWRFSGAESFQDTYPRGIMPGDWFTHMLHAQKGKIGYIDKMMAAYRRHSEGSWWESTVDQNALHTKFGLEELNFFIQMEKYFPEYLQLGGEGRTTVFAIQFFQIFMKNGETKKAEQILQMRPQILELVQMQR